MTGTEQRCQFTNGQKSKKKYFSYFKIIFRKEDKINVK